MQSRRRVGWYERWSVPSDVISATAKEARYNSIHDRNDIIRFFVTTHKYAQVYFSVVKHKFHPLAVTCVSSATIGCKSKRQAPIRFTSTILQSHVRSMLLHHLDRGSRDHREVGQVLSHGATGSRLCHLSHGTTSGPRQLSRAATRRKGGNQDFGQCLLDRGCQCPILRPA